MPRNAVQNCSIEQIVSTINSLMVNQFDNGSWLPTNNRYRVDVIEKIKNDSRPQNGINSSDLREYTAVSAILHCTDGWTFLSRALKSIVNGDIPSAMFLTYYSELRALMSLFGTNGISVLGDKHYYFDERGDAILTTGGGTHTIVRKILAEYINNPSKAALLLSWIKVGNRTLSEWLRATGFQTNYVMEDFLRHWGLDINEVRADHDARNNASYRPHTLDLHTYKYSYKEYLNRIIDIWKLCEPIGNGFSQLDFYLLKKSLKMTFDILPYEDNQSNLDRVGEESYLSEFKTYVEGINRRLGSPLSQSQLISLTSFDTSLDSFLEQANCKTYDDANEQYDFTPYPPDELQVSLTF